MCMPSYLQQHLLLQFNIGIMPLHAQAMIFTAECYGHAWIKVTVLDLLQLVPGNEHGVACCNVYSDQLCTFHGVPLGVGYEPS